MKTVLLSFGALLALGLAAESARAEGALSYPMAAHVAAQYGIQHPGHDTRLVGHRYSVGYHHRPRGYMYRGFYGWRPPVVVYPPVPRRPVVVLPRPRPYWPRAYHYYRPFRGFSYHAPGISIGIGF